MTTPESATAPGFFVGRPLGELGAAVGPLARRGAASGCIDLALLGLLRLSGPASGPMALDAHANSPHDLLKRPEMI